MMQIINKTLSRFSRPGVFSMGVAVTLLLGVIDFFTSVEIAFDTFYLAPIAFVTWYGSRNLGLAVSAGATVAWLIGCTIPEHLLANPPALCWNIVGEFGTFAVIVFLLAALKRRLALMEELASLDHLTRVANRRSFYQIASAEAKRCQRYGTAFTIAYIDIDDFKSVNDTFGHAEGDELLRCVAASLRANTRATDTVGRIGGDEFVVLLPETDEEQSKQTIEKLRAQLREAACSMRHPVTYSIGVVTFVKAPLSVEEMLNCVDEVMYAVKRANKDSVNFARWPELKTLDKKPAS
jgi:diguanylate cyclase (GGDEF)-like protein